MESVAASKNFEIGPYGQRHHADAADSAWVGLASLQTHMRLNYKAPTHLLSVAEEHFVPLARHQIVLRALHLEIDCAKLHLLICEHLKLFLSQLHLLEERLDRDVQAWET